MNYDPTKVFITINGVDWAANAFTLPEDNSAKQEAKERERKRWAKEKRRKR